MRTNSDVLAVSVEDGEVRVNIGDSTNPEGGGECNDCAVWSNADGFVSIPNLPDENGACQTVWEHDGNDAQVTGLKDTRYADKIGEGKAGDRFIVSKCAARFILKQEQSSITIYSENQTDSNTSMMINLDGSTGELLFAVGPTFFQMNKEKIVAMAGGTMFKVDSEGFACYGPHFAANTAGGNLGQVGGVAPIKGVNAITMGPVGASAVGSANWTVAP